MFKRKTREENLVLYNFCFVDFSSSIPLSFLTFHYFICAFSTSIKLIVQVFILVLPFFPSQYLASKFVNSVFHSFVFVFKKTWGRGSWLKIFSAMVISKINPLLLLVISEASWTNNLAGRFKFTSCDNFTNYSKLIDITESKICR